MTRRSRVRIPSVAKLAAAALLGVLVGAPFPLTAAAQAQEDPFPHADHEGLFPLCAGCHGGVESGDPGTVYPDVESCTNCHDDVEEERVEWNGAPVRVTNVRYEHLEHAVDVQEDGEDALSCESCHSDPEGPRMTVDGVPELETCFGCHTHEAEEHYGDADCASCHVPLAESGFPVQEIADLPTPVDHDTDGILGAHENPGLDFEAARCATCHTQDRCIDCHVDVGRPEIEEVPAAPSTMNLPETHAEYPTPGTHEASEFLRGHGRGIKNTDCATCHTQDDCASCHVTPTAAVVTDLARRSEVRAPGAALVREDPDSHESPFFIQAHSWLAGSEESSCATCHTEETCSACHNAPSQAVFHTDDFVLRHAADAYGQSSECANCHSVQVFCRACHLDSGLQGQGRLGPGFHDAEPIFLLRHGQAARQSLESCASCHAQTDCVQCHSETGAFQINPHGPDFEPNRARARNAAVCFACHLRIPGGQS